MARPARPLAERNGASDARTTPVKVKPERKPNVKEESAKRDSGKRRAQDDPEEEEDAGQDDEDDDEQDGSPKGRKRARVNTDGDSRPSQENAREKRVETLPRDVDGFIPGSIMRIQLKNFVTYDYVEFRLGPHLNMIIGPNGTGKSTIACAICIGLNWPPATLGRANEVNLFVKQGTTDGYIEIELKGPKGKGNLIIRRLLRADSKTSTFMLNGVGATGKEVSNQMAALNVQVGNLCSFLPQDKVSEFAAMSPQQLLRETQRAAGDRNLESWHQTLIEDGAEFKKILEMIKTEEEQLKQMRDRNEAIERDVQRYKERKKIEEEIKLLAVLIPVQQYRELRDKYFNLKILQRQWVDKVRRLKEKNAPAHAFREKLERQHSKLDKERDRLKKAIQEKMKQINSKITTNDKLEGESEEIQMKLDNLVKEEKARANKIKNAETTIEKLHKEMQREVKVESDATVNEEMRQLRRERQTVLDRKNALDAEIRANSDAAARQSRQVAGKKEDIKKLDDVDVQKLNNLSQWNRDTAETVRWLRQNKDKFQMEVFEPPCLSVSVTNRQYAAAVEAVIGGSHTTFVTQCKEDYDTFNRIVNDTPAVCGRRIRVTAWHRPKRDGMYTEPPCTREELKELGFDGYVLDYVTYPEGLLWFLQCELRMHRVAVGDDRIDVKKAMEAVTRREPANFITGWTMNQVTRSSYGRRLASNMTRTIRPARTFGAGSVDPELKARLERELNELQLELTMYNEEDEKLKQRWTQLGHEDSDFARRSDELKKRKAAIEAEVTRQTNIKTQLTRAENNLKQLQNAPSVEEDRRKYKANLLKVCLRRLQIIKEYRDLGRGIIGDQNEAARIGLEYLQVGANVAAVKRMCAEKDVKYEAAVVQFNKVNQEYATAKTESKNALDDSRRALADAEPDIKERQDVIATARNTYDKDLKTAEDAGTTLPDSDGVDLRSSEELGAELERQEAQLEITLNTNPGVMEEYEKRKRDIEVLERTLETKQSNRDRVAKNIKKARDNWEPALRELVDAIGAKFSEAFDGIGCAGEIRVTPHDDFDKWAIDILVKFRDDEKLQLLTGQRQSGGERSLTTILYLMSLTEQARAPFSLVDEINQGMDQRAERLVHNNMVRVTCKEDSGQYFLITPKLLPDLQYHEKMKVLCVNNGEWLPEETGIGSMRNMIEGYVAKSRAAGRGANSI
ncbi:P-loop containing nucleoside triphosphate hydrolase protein [Hymenopellis radicata]|nr:P-loop containing nucleoside triphosphate hydrolase protein [Hymenopellis radicata]